MLKDACFPGQGYTGLNLQIRVLKGDATHPRFTLASKGAVQRRSVH